ncbi:hypothetical protein ABIB45_001143 [Arthrobacter sp. UYCo732]
MTRMKRTPVYITVRENNTTVIDSHPEGFPVDGDALHDCATLRKRAEALINSDRFCWPPREPGSGDPCTRATRRSAPSR